MYVGIDKKMCLLYVSKCMRSLLSCNQKNKFLKDNFGSLIFEDTDVAQIPELYYITGTRYKKLYIRESVDFIWRQLYTRKACINYEEAQIIFVLVVLKLLTEYSRNPQYSSLKEIIKKDWLEFRPLLIIDRSLEIYQGLVEAEIIANDNYEGIVSLWENLKIDCLIVEFELFKALENLSKAINVKFDVDVCIKDDMIKLTISNIDTSNERVINELMWLQMVINIFMDGNPYYCVTEYINLVCLLFIKNHKSEDMDWLTDVQTLCGVNEFIGEIDASLYDSDDEVVRALKEIIKTPNKYKEYENKALFEAWLENLHAIVKRTLSEYEYL